MKTPTNLGLVGVLVCDVGCVIMGDTGFEDQEAHQHLSTPMKYNCYFTASSNEMQHKFL